MTGLIGYVDASHANDERMRSVEGYVVFFNGTPVSPPGLGMGLKETRNRGDIEYNCTYYVASISPI
ncbi:uncharacterized protein N7483_000064 [Penicillium malachiteum]|uniref:uncharacterized protein n=1 Tax=Penicillium malachiteum TaxID=1324776 RepID=UPI0025478006|nr:uncharacterized protein N7483_000064 [Penicillium malachiteum]KAJ5734939.1 hypothetical protein N7483_000064 [Penicillium malachiteum]